MCFPGALEGRAPPEVPSLMPSAPGIQDLVPERYPDVQAQDGDPLAIVRKCLALYVSSALFVFLGKIPP